MRQCLLSIVVIAVCLTAVVGSVYANPYDIDGNVGDWGIILNSASAAKGYLEKTHATGIPTGGLDIDFDTEDNAGDNVGWQHVTPGYSYWGNDFDVEAVYFDNDLNNIYIAVVQGLPVTGGTAPGNPWFMPGDIAIDIDGILNNGSYSYEYAIDTDTFDSGSGKAMLKSASAWSPVYYSGYAEANPWRMSAGTDKGLVDFAYSQEQYSHYVLEARIPLSLLGLDPAMDIFGTRNIGIHWTMQCGNDYINLRADINPVAPEPSTLLLFGFGAASMAAGIYRRKERKA